MYYELVYNSFGLKMIKQLNSRCERLPVKFHFQLPSAAYFH